MAQLVARIVGVVGVGGVGVGLQLLLHFVGVSDDDLHHGDGAVFPIVPGLVAVAEDDCERSSISYCPVAGEKPSAHPSSPTHAVPRRSE